MKARLRPHSLQTRARIAVDLLIVLHEVVRGRNYDVIPMNNLSHMQYPQSFSAQRRKHLSDISFTHLHNSTQFLIEQAANSVIMDCDSEPHLPRKRHLGDRHEQATIATIVISKQLPLTAQALHLIEESLQLRRLRSIRSL